MRALVGNVHDTDVEIGFWAKRMREIAGGKSSVQCGLLADWAHRIKRNRGTLVAVEVAAEELTSV